MKFNDRKHGHSLTSKKGPLNGISTVKSLKTNFVSLITEKICQNTLCIMIVAKIICLKKRIRFQTNIFPLFCFLNNFKLCYINFITKEMKETLKITFN